MKQNVYISLVYIFLAVLAFFVVNNTVIHSINDTNALVIPSDDFSPSFVKHEVDNKSVGVQTYTYEFNKESLNHIKGETFTVIINKETYQAIKVEINGQAVLLEGDMLNGKSRLKNSFSTGVFNRDSLKENNIIKIQTYASYKSGIEDDSIYIVSSSFGNELIRKLNFYSNSLIIFGLGILFLSALFIILIYMISVKKDISFIYCALAVVFFGVYFLDYIKIVSCMFDFLTVKKIHMLSLYIGSFFYTLALSSFLRKNILKYSMFTTLLVFIVVMFVSTDMIMFKKLYDYLYVVYLVNIILAFVLCIVNFNTREYTYIFLIGFVAIFLYAGSAIILELIGDSFAINSPFVYIVVLATLPILLGVNSLLSYEKEIDEVHELKNIETTKAETDGLTGLLNRRFVMEKLQSIVFDDDTMYPLSVAMIDIDHFKIVNDEFGHMVGDSVLVALAETLKTNTRTRDFICRYGGEELLIIFTNTDCETAHRILDRILVEFKQKTEKIVGRQVSFSGGITTVESASFDDLSVLIEKADALLYKAKNTGRDKILSCL